MKINLKNKMDKQGKNFKTYKEAIRDELKNNSIVLSFAFSIVIIGIISVFYTNNNSLLIGIAISSLLLTLIQCFSNGNTLLNILPVFTLLIFGFFQKSIENIPIINILMKEQYANLIIFLSFGLTFLTQAYKNIIFKHELNEALVYYNQEKNKMIYAQLDTIKNIKSKIMKIRKISQERGLNEDNLSKGIEDLLNYVEDETFISNVKSTLITKGSEDKKNMFNIEEVEESIILNSGLGRNREINASKIPDDDIFI